MVSLVADRGWQAATAIGKIWGEWASLVGPTLAEHVRPEAFDRTTGRLTLRADSTAWATQVRMLSGQLRKRLQGEIPGEIVTDITVLGPDVGPKPRGKLRVKGREPATPTAERGTQIRRGCLPWPWMREKCLNAVQSRGGVLMTR